MSVHPCPFCSLRFAAHTERDSHVDAEHRERLGEEARESIVARRLPAGAHAGAVLRGPW
jgi:hypothetical protein